MRLQKDSVVRGVHDESVGRCRVDLIENAADFVINECMRSEVLRRMTGRKKLVQALAGPYTLLDRFVGERVVEIFAARKDVIPVHLAILDGAQAGAMGLVECNDE